MYAVNAVVVSENGEGRVARPLPLFLLDPKVQGILDDAHARQVALDIVMPFPAPGLTAYVSVTRV